MTTAAYQEINSTALPAILAALAALLEAERESLVRQGESVVTTTSAKLADALDARQRHRDRARYAAGAAAALASAAIALQEYHRQTHQTFVLPLSDASTTNPPA